MHRTQLIEKNIEYLPAIYLTQTMKQLYQKSKLLAGNSHPSVLIVGERGTGKELLAKSIHYKLSPNLPFVTINCVNLPFDHFEAKIEKCFDAFSELAPSVAKNSTGQATLFLRDIGKLKPSVQKELFSMLQERFFTLSTAADSTLQHIRLMFSYEDNGSTPAKQDKLFDRVTYRRFNPYLLSIIPLRDRREDIQPLAQFFVDKFAKEYDKDIGGLHSSAIKVMESYAWPGNVSELRDIIENATLLSQGPLITKEDIRFNISKKSIALESFLSREDFFSLEELERIYIQTVLRRVKNNKSKAAKILSISRNTLQRKVDAFTAKPTKKKSKKKNTNRQPALF